MPATHDRSNVGEQWEKETIEETRQRLRRDWGDYPLTIILINPINLRLVRKVARTSLTPNQLTLISFGFMGLAALSMASTNRMAQILGGILILAGYLVDCLDGDLARLKDMRSPLGAMLDPMLDRLGEIAVGLGAAMGGMRATNDPTWLVYGMLFIGASQFYFYVVDAMLIKLPNNANQPSSGGALTIFNTRVRLGAIEPYIWGQACFAFAGVAYWAMPVFAVMFTIGGSIQLARIINKSKNAAHLDPDRFGTHTTDR